MWMLLLAFGLIIFLLIMIAIASNRAKQKREAKVRAQIAKQQHEKQLEQRHEKEAKEKKELQAFMELPSIRAQAGNREIKVVGVSNYQNELDIISEADFDGPVKRLQTAILYPELHNPVDENAIQVIIVEKPIGYLSAANAEKYRPIVELAKKSGRKITCSAEIVGGFTMKNDELADLGVRLQLQSPTSLKRLLEDRLGKASRPA